MTRVAARTIHPDSIADSWATELGRDTGREKNLRHGPFMLRMNAPAR